MIFWKCIKKEGAKNAPEILGYLNEEDNFLHKVLHGVAIKV